MSGWWAAYLRWRGSRSPARHRRDAPLNWSGTIAIAVVAGLSAGQWDSRPWLTFALMACAVLICVAAIAVTSAVLERRNPL